MQGKEAKIPLAQEASSLVGRKPHALKDEVSLEDLGSHK